MDMLNEKENRKFLVTFLEKHKASSKKKLNHAIWVD